MTSGNINTGNINIGSVTSTARLDIYRPPPFVSYSPYLFHAWSTISDTDLRQVGVVIDNAGNIRANTSVTISGNPFQSLPDFVLGKNYMVGVSSDLAVADPSLLILTPTTNGGPHVEAHNGTPTAGALVFRVANDGTVTTSGKVGIGTTSPTSPLQVVGLPVYANNAAAVAGGLTAGALYRTGADPDPVCVVH
jgi:hypothetical protein